MSDMFIIILSFVTGILMGTFFFGGLWLTLKRLPDSRNPVLLTMGSYFGRIAVCVSGFYVAVKIGDWEGLLVFMGGFMIMRFALVRHLRPGNGSFLRGD